MISLAGRHDSGPHRNASPARMPSRGRVASSRRSTTSRDGILRGRRHGRLSTASRHRPGHDQLACDRVRRRRRDPRHRPARVHAALSGRRVGGARPRGDLVGHPGGDARGARSRRRRGGRDRHHQPARDHGGMGPRDRRSRPPRHRLAGPSHGRAVPGVARSRTRAGREREDRTAARSVLLRHQARMDPRPRRRRSRSRGGRRPRVRHHRHVPHLAPHRRRRTRHRRHQRVAHPALRHPRPAVGRIPAATLRRAARRAPGSEGQRCRFRDDVGGRPGARHPHRGESPATSRRRRSDRPASNPAW